MEPRTEQIIQRSLTTPSKHGCQHWEDTMTLLRPIYEQPQSSPNFFQPPAPPSCSTHLTCVSTARWSQAPSKSSNDRSAHPPNMDASIGKMPCLFLHPVLSTHIQHHTTSNEQLLLLAPLTQLVFCLLDASSPPANHPTIAHHTLQPWMQALGRCHACS